jgi:leucyl-tRNA synthetase
MQSPENHYIPKEVELKWQEQWDQLGLHRTPEPGMERAENFYALSMFPYPSGNLHMGHVRNYVITDVIARVQRLKGKRVLHPMGWDAFGLPAENAAIERGIDPGEWTIKNIEQMRKQLKRLGLSIDWQREVTTCKPSYYRWNQWLFLQFLDAKLAYQKEATVNWDPIDNTVLANEQVNSEGRSWRSGAIVEKRKLKQWFLKITEFADQLIDDLSGLKGWPERVCTMQANWIGRSVGAELKFRLVDANKKSKEKSIFIDVFTTRPDTIYGVSYLVLAPEHPLVKQITTESQNIRVMNYIAEVASRSEIDRIAEDRPKTGVALGSMVTHPLTGREIPVWIADYVLPDYGTGAVMGVPGHDKRDFDFASKYNLTITQVLERVSNQDEEVLINSERYNGLNSESAKQAIIEEAEENGFGKAKITYRLRDWLISRQRYWGCPIPVVHCDQCGVVPVPVEQLPIQLPPYGSSWEMVKCPSCDMEARPETDTMDTFVCSSWYFLRYTDSFNENQPFSIEATNAWLPVDQYVGGVEHAILHLLYSRFFTKVLNSRNLIKSKEPFNKLLTQGMVQAITYRNPITEKYIPANLISDPLKPNDPDTGDKLEVFYEKMSKSKYNGVDPSTVIDKYGADTARMFILFKAPPEKDLEWDDADVEGQFRFLQRIWRICQLGKGRGIRLQNAKLEKSGQLSTSEKIVRRAVHGAIEAINEDLSGNDLQLNTAISELMKLNNILNSEFENIDIQIAEEAFKNLLILLAPFAPHLADELWQQLGGVGSVHQQQWPIADKKALTRETISIALQIKGKLRGNLEVPADIDNASLEKIVLTSEIASKWLEGVTPSKIIVVPGKLVNLVP